MRREGRRRHAAESQENKGGGLSISQVSRSDADFDPIELEILWGRLVAIVDESATALQRTSFSTTVRDSNDFACVLLGPDGTALAENTLGVPSFAGVMSLVMRRILERYPAETWR